MIEAIRIASSGMQAAATRLSVSASNIVNMQSNGAVPATSPDQPVAQTEGSVYQPVAAVQTAQLGGGVSTTVSPTTPSYVLTYAPSSPDADAQGMVASPNIDITQQVTEQLTASLAYKANAKVFETADNTEKKMLDMAV